MVLWWRLYIYPLAATPLLDRYVCGKDYDILYPSLGTTWKVPDTNTSLGWMLLDTVSVLGFEDHAQVAPKMIRLDGTHHERFNSTPKWVNSISTAHLHVRPMGRTCG